MKSVLSFPVIELLFVTVSGMEAMAWICTQSSVSTESISYCWAVPAHSRYFLLVTLPEQVVSWGCTGDWVETQLWQLSPSICLQRSPLWTTKPCCPWDACLPPRSVWSIALNPYLLCLCVELFLYLLNCLYLNSSFFRWKWVSSSVVLSYHLGLNHTTPEH